MAPSEYPFKSHFQVEWRDVDIMGHMRNTAYAEYASQTRTLYFRNYGHPLEEIIAKGAGPVAVRDEIFYFKELRLLDEFSVSFWLDGMNQRQTRFRYINEFINRQSEVVSMIVTDGIWMDIHARKLIRPAEEIVKAILELPKSASFSPVFQKKPPSVSKP
jgi:acyl-CoA thioester hydrolase